MSYQTLRNLIIDANIRVEVVFCREQLLSQKYILRSELEEKLLAEPDLAHLIANISYPVVNQDVWVDIMDMINRQISLELETHD